jgi:hypothetical protein
MISSVSGHRLKVVSSAIFRRRGRPGAHTDIFERLTQQDRDLVLGSIQPLGDELPILASITRQGVWCLLTTSRLISARDGQIDAMPLVELADARVDLGSLQLKGVTKDRNCEVQIVSSKGTRRSIEVEPGAPLNGFLSVLMYVVRLNSRR